MTPTEVLGRKSAAMRSSDRLHVGPDAFLLDQCQRDPETVFSAFAALRATLRSAPEPDRLLERLTADGQSLTAADPSEAWRQRTVRL